MRVIGPRRLNIGGILVEVGYSPEWRWVKRPKRGGFGSVVDLVGIGVMPGTPRGAERMPSSKRSLLARGFLDGVKAWLDPSPFLCPAGIVVVAWGYNMHKKGSG